MTPYSEMMIRQRPSSEYISESDDPGRAPILVPAGALTGLAVDPDEAGWTPGSIVSPAPARSTFPAWLGPLAAVLAVGWLIFGSKRRKSSRDDEYDE